MAARRFHWPAAVARWGAGALLGVLGLLCFDQSTRYHDSITLFRASIARQPDHAEAARRLEALGK